MAQLKSTLITGNLTVTGVINAATFLGNAASATKTANAITFNNGGSGVASGTTFDGSVARTVSYNTIGAAPTSHASSATTYGIATTSNYGHVKIQTGNMNGTTNTDGIAAGLGHTHSNYDLPSRLGATQTSSNSNPGESGFYYYLDTTNGTVFGTQGQASTLVSAYSSTWAGQIGISYYEDVIAFRRKENSSTWGAWMEIAQKSAIPTKVSQLTNDSSFTSNTGTVTSVRVQAGTGLSSSVSTAQTSSLNTTISIASGYKLPTTDEWNAIGGMSLFEDVDYGSVWDTGGYPLYAGDTLSLYGVMSVDISSDAGSIYLQSSSGIDLTADDGGINLNGDVYLNNSLYAYSSSSSTTLGQGTSGQVLKSNGSGKVYWASDNSGSSYSAHVRGTTSTTGTSRYTLPAASARQIHTWWRTTTDMYSNASGNTWAGSILTVQASTIYAMQSYLPVLSGTPGSLSSNYGQAISASGNSGMFATTLDAMGGSSWVSPAKGDFVIDPYGCIGVIETIPIGTTVQSAYHVRVVYKSNTKWNYTCVEEGTLITMSDGTYRPVEELDQGDLIMGWDFENDKPIEAVTLFARQTQNLDKMTYMIFSNGEYISFSAEHELYSKTHQKYMFINDLKEGDIVMGKDGEDVEIMSIHRDIWSFGRKNFYQVVSSNNTYFANNILNAMHPINKLNWVQYGLMQEIPQEIMEIFVEDCREFDCWQFLIQDKAFLKQAVSIQREMKLRSNRIDELKQYLAKTDYVALKYSEGELVDTSIIEQRQASRLEINKLEDELNNQYQPEYNELLTSHALIGEDILLNDTERQIKYFRLACKRDNENLELFKKYYPVQEKAQVDWENYITPMIEEEESE